MYRVLGVDLSIKPHIWSLFQQHWNYLVMGVYFYLRFSIHIIYTYILYIYQRLEKKEISSTRDAGRKIVMVEISARRPEPLQKSLSLQKVWTFSITCLPARLSCSPLNSLCWRVAKTPRRSAQSLITLPAKNWTCFGFCKTKWGFPSLIIIIIIIIIIINKTKLRGLSPRANYTDRAAAAGRRS